MDDFAVEVRLTVHGSVRATSATQASRAVGAQVHQHLSRLSIADLEVDIGEIATRRAVVT
ncbi:MAG: hypothetical protein Q7J48_16495 [Nocardioides sp.]|nr:hypothetical protein [Nocardioides sp.]